MENEEYQIFVSEVAAEQIKEQLQKRGTPDGFLRLGVKGGGCSGFSYVLRFEDSSPREIDKTFQINGVNIVVDTKSLLYLKGCTLDWETSLVKRGFKFINPNEKSQCGCGHSFTV
jgi:iron-sulfur cluster assembly protein